MKLWQIESHDGIVYGRYEGETAQIAFDAMVDAAGSGAEGAVSDWIITEIEATAACAHD